LLENIRKVTVSQEFRNLVLEFPRHFEGQPYPDSIERFEDAVWLTIISMTTVGFGDLFPRTLIGRIIDVIVIIWGLFIVSLMVVVMTNSLNISQAERRALIILTRLEAKKELKEAAAFLITHSCRKYLISKKIKQGFSQPLTETQKSNFNNTLYKHIVTFQCMNQSIRKMYEIDDIYEEMSRQFSYLLHPKFGASYTANTEHASASLSTDCGCRLMRPSS
jgi:hypothetical protein